MPKNAVADGKPWKECSICGFDYPIDRLRKQKGHWRCTDTCYEDLSYERAQRRVHEQINPPLEGENKFAFYDSLDEGVDI